MSKRFFGIFAILSMLAIAFMFSCSSGNDDGFQPPSSSSSPPSGSVSSSSSLGSSSSVTAGGGTSSSSSVTTGGGSSSSSVTAGGGGSSSSSVTTGGGTSSSSSDGNSDECTDNSYYGVGPSLTYEGKTYKTVKIGCQTWMAENLSYNAPGSRCYGEGSIVWEGDYLDPREKTLSEAEIQANCVKYGRLYDWATAMALPSNCNYSNDCQIQTKHRGICPSGWHIPSEADWEEELFHFGSIWDKEGKHLKATNGWDDYNEQNGNGEDTYGFAALPGGIYYNPARFCHAGEKGFWWSTSPWGPSRTPGGQDLYYVDTFDLHSESEVGGWHVTQRSYMISVRCLKD